MSKEEIIQKAAQLANEKGLSYVTVTTLSNYLGIKKPSLYNHMKTIDDVVKSIMIYGWRCVSEDILVGISDENPGENLKNYAKAFYRFAIDNPGIFEAMLWYNKYESEDLSTTTEGLYKFFFEQTERLGIEKSLANHFLRTYRSFLEGFIMLEIHHSFGNPISISESFEISLDVLLKGMNSFRKEEPYDL